jgi:hypothetical protein
MLAMDSLPLADLDIIHYSFDKKNKTSSLFPYSVWQQQKLNLKRMVRSHLNELEDMLYTVGKVWKSSSSPTRITSKFDQYILL